MHKFIKHICSASLSAVLFISWLNIEIGFNSLSEQLPSASNNLEIDSLFLKILTLVLIFSPTLALFIYNRSQILTKYVINEFLPRASSRWIGSIRGCSAPRVRCSLRIHKTCSANVICTIEIF